uniref:Musculoskeletal embryonic nuclear protein 1 n=1 Tax=Denticeps clupeoides TaxID=299321 RepID=A0AAY3ZZS5_9TELE
MLEPEKVQRPEVQDKDLLKARDQLIQEKELKSKTFEVMEGCERVGKVAPSVFTLPFGILDIYAGVLFSK